MWLFGSEQGVSVCDVGLDASVAGKCSTNRCALSGMGWPKLSEAETLPTPARSEPRLLKSWVTSPGTRTNDPVPAENPTRRALTSTSVRTPNSHIEEIR